MTVLHIGAVCATVAVLAWGCKGDPTADLRGGPNAIQAVPSQIFVDSGKAVSLVVSVQDAQLNPLAVDVAVQSADAAIASVAVDTTRPAVDGARHAFVVTALKAGQTTLNVSGGGLSESVPTTVGP